MTSILLEDKSISSFEKALLSLQESSQAIIILACDENDFSKEILDPILQKSTLPIIGGIFPAIVYKNRQYDEGTILLGLNNTFTVTTIHNISHDRDYEDIIEKNMGPLHDDINTMFLFFDGVSQNIDTIIQAIFNNFGLSINYVGGSAAGKNFSKKPILFSNEGLLEDVAIFATSTAESTIGVKHGWESIETITHQVTKSEGNVIYEIDYQSAFKVYKEIVKKHLKKRLHEINFFQAAKSYPLGITRLTGDSIVRVAMGEGEEDSLICSGDIPENSYIQILHAEDAELIEAAKKASMLSQNKTYHKSFKLYIGCLARLIVMGKNFHKEIEAIYKDGELMVGALSVGEIANNKDHYLELYNATAVVAKIADA